MANFVPLGPSGQSRLNDPRLGLAQALLSGNDRPVRTTTGAFSQIGEKLIGAFLAKGALDDQKQAVTTRNQAFARALGIAQGTGGDVPPGPDFNVASNDPSIGGAVNGQPAVQAAVDPARRRGMVMSQLLSAGVPASEAIALGKALVPDTPKRQFAKDVAGFQRDVKTGKRLFPTAQANPPKPPSATNLAKLIAERDALPPDSPRRALFNAAIQKAVTSSNLDIQFNEDGTVKSISQGRGQTKPPSGNRQDEIRARKDANNTALDTLDRVQQMIEDDPTAAGIAGTARAAGQNIIGAFTDIARVVGNTIGVDIAGGRTAGELSKFFDPNLPAIDIAENSLAYALARTRKPTGRLNRQDFENAKEDVRLRGFTSSQDALARLDVIRGMFAKSGENLDRRLGKSTGAKQDFDTLSDDEVLKRLFK